MTQQVALITGASRGIGRQVAHYFAQQGYSLILVARDANRLDALRQTLPLRPGQRIKSVAVDLCHAPSAATQINDALADFAQLDVLVNAAGIFRPGSSGATLGDFTAMLDVNVTAIHHLCQLCLPALTRAAKAHIFNLASVSGVQAFGGIAGYAASKHALVGYSLSLSRELAAQGVKVTVLCPDVVDTDMSQGSGLTPQQMIEKEDICRAIEFVMSLSPAAMVEQLTLGRMRR